MSHKRVSQPNSSPRDVFYGIYTVDIISASNVQLSLSTCNPGQHGTAWNISAPLFILWLFVAFRF